MKIKGISVYMMASPAIILLLLLASFLLCCAIDQAEHKNKKPDSKGKYELYKERRASNVK